MGRVKIAALSAVVTTFAVVVVGGFILWLASPGAVDDPRTTADLSQLAAIQSSTPQPPVAAPQQSAPPAASPVATAPDAGAAQAPSAVASTQLAGGVQLFPLTHPIYAAAYDEESGHLLVATRTDNQADLYDTAAGAQLIVSTPAPTKPKIVVEKRIDGKPLFVVSGEADSRLDMIDGTTGAAVKSVTAAAPTIAWLVGDEVEKPYVYYIPTDDKPIGRINLQTLTEETEQWPDDGLEKMRIRSLPGHQLDGHGAYVAYEQKIVANDLQTEIGALDFRVSAFVPGTPWVAGIKSTDVCVGSINSFQTIGSVPLPEEFFQSRDQIEDPRRVRRPARSRVARANPSSKDYEMFADAKRQRLLVVSGSQLAIVPLAAFNLPQEPSLAVEISGPRVAEVYKPIDLSIRKIDPSIELASVTLPEGMTLAGDHLKWTPAGNQLGTHPIKLEARADKYRREYNLQLQVSRPVIELQFVARRVALSNDGTKAVVWGFEKSDPNSGRRLDSYSPKQELGVVDVAARRVLATRKMPRGVQSAAVDENGVYVVLINSEAGFPSEVHHLNLADLTVIKTASTEKPVEERDASIVLVGGKTLAFGDEKFSLPSLRRMPNPYASSDTRFQSLQGPRGGTTDYGDYIWSSGMLWDKDLTQPQVLVNPPCFAGLETRDQEVQWNRPQTKWGRHAWHGMLEGPNGSNLFPNSQSGHYGPLMLWDLPAAVMYHWDSPPMPRLVFRELVKGDETQTIDLGGGPNREESYENEDLVKSAGSVIAACVSGQLHVVSLDEVDKTKFKAPFRVALKQAMVLENDRKATLHYDLLDGQPPYQLKMTIGEAKFSAENEQDGTIEVDTTQFATELQNVARGRIQSLAQSPNAKAADCVLDYIEYVTPLFEKITGRKPNGVPCVVPVRLEVTDKELNVARLSHAYLCEVSQAKIVKDLDTYLVQNRRSREQTAEMRSRRDPTVPTVRERPAKPEKQAKAANSIRRQERDKLLRELAADYSSVLLKRNPPDKVLDEQVEAAAKVARDEADKQFVEILDKHKTATKGGMRKWSDNAGHETMAALSDVFAEQVVLTRQSGGQVTVPIEKLSAADQEFIKSAQEAGAGVRPEEYVPAQMELLMRGISAHSHQMQVYPPAFLKGKDSNPQLSWRVLILPYIGGQKLFELFKLDEPWDSEHNRKLLKFRPGVYSTLDQEVSATHTTMLALRGRGSLMADSTPVSPNDVADELDSIMVLAEMKADKAVEWTRPDDFEDAMFEQIFQCVEQRDGKAYVSMANGTVRSLSSDTLAEELRKAVNIADDAEGDIKFDDAIAAAAGAKTSLAATRPRSKAIRSNDRLDHSLEEIPIGKFILSAEKADPKLFGPEEVRGGLKVRAVPFHDDGTPGSADCVVSPDGLIFGLVGRSLVRFDPAKGRIEAQATMREPINAIHWCFGKLLLVGSLGDYIEYQNERGAWRRFEDKVTVAPANARARRTEGMQVWIVDPSTLKTLRGFVVPGTYLLCAPGSARVLAAHGGRNSSDRIDLIDLKRGEQTATLPKRSEQNADDGGNGDRLSLDDVAIMPDGESAIAMTGGRFNRIEFAEDGMVIRPGAASFNAEHQFGWMHITASADMQFAAVLASGRARVLPEGYGYLVFKTPQFDEACGGITADRNNRECALGLDTERRIVYVASEDGKLRVLRGKKAERYEGLPAGCKRIVPVPKRDAVLLLGTSSVLVSISGKSDVWAFDPPSKDLVFEKSPLRGKAPAPPRAFSKNEGEEAISLAGTDYSVAGVAADGDTLYLFDAGNRTVSAFDTKTWQERQRLEGGDMGFSTFQMTALGPMVFDGTDTYHLLDGKTLSGINAFKLPEIKSFTTAAGSNMMTAVTNFGYLRLIDLRTGKLVAEVPSEKVLEWDADELSQTADRPPPTNLVMSADGKVLSCRVMRIHFLHVNETGFEHYLRTGPVSNNGSGAMLSPSGKYANYASANGEYRVFELPNVSSALTEVHVSPIAVDDRGWQYGQPLERSTLAVFKPDGKAVYPSDPNAPGRVVPESILLDAAHPGRMIMRTNGVWTVLDVKE